MNLSFFDQTRESEQSFYGEAVRLSNELRAKPAQTIIDRFGNRIDLPARDGFDIETCSVNDIQNWLNDFSIKKSQSLLIFVFRIFCIRFPVEYSEAKNLIDARFKREMEYIESEARNETEWFGQVGYSNFVRLDGSLTDPKLDTVIKDDTVIFKRI